MPSNLYLIAGANGSGKTTFAREFLPNFVHCREFLNADLMAEGISPFAAETAAVRAGRLLLERIQELAAEKKDFGFETTMAGKSYARTFRQMKEQGYAVHCYFLWLPSVEMAVARVAHRVSQGGHDIPESVIRRRYAAGLRNLFTLYRSLFDSWILYNNSLWQPKMVAAEKQGVLKVLDSELFNGSCMEWSIQLMNSPELEKMSLEEKSFAALRQAARRVVEEARRNGTSVVVWQDGQVREIPAAELPDPATLLEEQ